MSKVITIYPDNGAVVRAVQSEYYPVGTIATVYGRVDDLFIPQPHGGGAQIWDRIADWESVVDAPEQPLGWVSVADRLPHRGQEVLVYRPNAPESGDPVIRTAFYGRRGATGHDLEGFTCYVQPTHWMPLPRAPR